VVDATEDTFAEAAERSSLPALVDIWAPWCGPCRMLTPALEHLAAERAGNLKLVKVNADENPRLLNRFEIKSIPTVLVMKDGEVKGHHLGAVPLVELRTWLSSILDKESVP
jgi:thioredoxin 2